MVAARAQPLLATSILFPTLALIAVVLRIYTRFFILRNGGPDDYLIVASMCASFGFMTVALFQIKYGLGAHFGDVSPEDLTRFLQCLWATIPIYNLSLVLCKLAITMQYRRVFATPLIRKICNGVLAFLAVYGCWTVIGSALMCIPVQFFWGVGEGACMDRLAFWFSNAALNIASDIFILALPIPSLLKLQVPLRQKIILLVVFLFGTFVCVTSIVRLKSLLEISVSTDTTFDGVDIAIWSGVEINIAIICASVPALKPLVNVMFPKLLGSTGGSGLRSNMGYMKQNSRHQTTGTHQKSKIMVQQSFELQTSPAGQSWNTSQSNLTQVVPSHSRS